MTLASPKYLLKAPISKYYHIGGQGFNIGILAGGHKSVQCTTPIVSLLRIIIHLSQCLVFTIISMQILFRMEYCSEHLTTNNFCVVSFVLYRS